MLKLIASLDWDRLKPALFITLTFPDAIVKNDCVSLTKWRAEFFRRMEKWAGKQVAAIWRLEWQVRKSGERCGQLMPHFHLIVFGVDYVHYSAVNEWWGKTLKYDGYLRTEVQGMTNERQLGYYVSKYAAKVSSSLVISTYLQIPPGRKWGVVRKNLLPFFELKTMRVCLDEVTNMAKERVEEEKPGWIRDEDSGFVLMGTLAAEIGRILFVDHDLENGEGE